jgi:hypothetical protein
VSSLRELPPSLSKFAIAFVELLSRFFGPVTVTSVRRSTGKQIELWTKCHTGQSRFPAAYPGSSPHERGIAFDIHIPPSGELVTFMGRRFDRVYLIAGQIWERAGLRWGGRFRDEIHFDFYPRGYTPPGDPRSCPGPGR